MATSDLLLEESPYLKLTAKGRKTGLSRTVELWFAFKDDKLYFLAHEDSQWWKNIARNPDVEVEVSEVLFKGKASLVQERLPDIFVLFRKKYGESQVERWYSGSRSKRKAVEVLLERVIAKRPSREPVLVEIAI